jgi:rhamnosyltransferase
VSEPFVSIVIPTRNGMDTLPGVIEAIAKQRVPFTIETLAVDSGSSDGTLEFLRARIDKVLTIPPQEFDHGRTRNLGIEHARGELVVLLVQDAQPASEDWLAALVAPLAADPAVAGAFARQLPRERASRLTRHYLLQWIGASTQARAVRVASTAAFEALPPLDRLDRCTFDNVCSCVRRSVWREYPFVETPIAEDVAWAKTVLLAGHTLAFAPASMVIHSHERPARYELARTYVLHRRLYDLFGVRTIPSLSALARSVAASLALHMRVEPGARGLLLAVAWPLGQYLGGLAAARRWPLARVRGV